MQLIVVLHAIKTQKAEASPGRLENTKFGTSSSRWSIMVFLAASDYLSVWRWRWPPLVSLFLLIKLFTILLINMQRRPTPIDYIYIQSAYTCIFYALRIYVYMRALIISNARTISVWVRWEANRRQNEIGWGLGGPSSGILSHSYLIIFLIFFSAEISVGCPLGKKLLNYKYKYC